jgi:hypothetical protein
VLSLSLTIPPNWPRPRTRTIIIIVVYVITIRSMPDATLPLSIGALLGSWLSTSLTQAAALPPAR